MSNINKINYKGTPYDIEDKTAREGLSAKQETLVSQTNIKSINTHSLLEAGDLQILLSECNNDSGFITRLVSDLENYYDKTKVEEMVSAIPKFSIKVVEQLPTENISNTTVYLVKDINVEGNLYTEWIHVSGVWEQLGMQNVDLKGYATEKWVQDQSYDTIASVDIKLNDKADKQETSNQLAGKLDKVAETEKVYATTALGDQTTLQYNVDPYGDGIVKRTSGGQVKTNDPTAENDAANKKYVDTIHQDLDHDKVSVHRYTLGSTKLTQLEATDIINQYSNFEGKLIEFLTNGDAPNKTVGYGYVCSNGDGDQFLITLTNDGTSRQWNKTDYLEHNVKFKMNVGVTDCDIWTIDEQGQPPMIIGGLENAYNKPEGSGSYGTMMVIYYNSTRQLQIYYDVESGNSWTKVINGTADHHEFGTWNKVGGSDVVANPEIVPDMPKLDSLGVSGTNYTIGGDQMIFSDTPVEGATPLANIEAGGMNWSLGSGGGSSSGPAITRVDTLPEPNEEEYTKSQIYDQNNNLSYIGKNVEVSVEQSKKSPTGELAHKWAGPYSGDLRNNEYYVVKGDNTICKYNLDTNVVSKVITNSLIVRSSIAYCKENDKFYLPGGEKTGTKPIGEKQILCYDPSTNTISKIADMPEGWRYNDSICANGYLYIFGGNRWNSGDTWNDKVYKMDIKNNQIVKLSSSIPGSSNTDGEISLTEYNNNIYFVKNDRLYMFNTSSESFEEIINFQTSVGGNPVIEIQNNIGFVVGEGGKIFRVDLMSKTFESIVMTVPSSSPTVSGANGSCIKDNTMYWFRFNYESKDNSCIFLIKNIINTTYSSMPVGGGGAEYEIVEIWTGDINEAKEFQSSNVLFWTVLFGEDPYSGVLNIIPYNRWFNKRYSNYLNGSLGSKLYKLQLVSLSDSVLSLTPVGSVHIYQVLAFRKKD